MIQRIITEKIIEHTKQYPVLALIGPRQSGKTTLVRSLFPEKPYVNLEEPDNRAFALKDPRGFLAQYNNSVIDEAQRAPQLFSYIQGIVDKEKQNGQFILTGSQNFLLMENITQSLAGRVSIFSLLPFSIKELSSKGNVSEQDIDTVMFKGLYPKLYDQKIDIAGYYSNYIQTYVERDVRTIQHITDLSAFRQFIELCAARTGQLLNITSLANDAGITHNTAKSWLSTLKTSFILFTLRPHHSNFNKRVVKMPKMYFYDTGLLCSLLGITNSHDLKRHYLKGGIFESFIVSEWLKHRYNNGLIPRAYFWRNKTGHEIDLIIDQADKYTAVEIKSGKTIANDYFKGLDYYQKLSGLDSKNMYIVYGGDVRQERQNGTVVPWYEFTTNLSRLEKTTTS